MKNLGLHSAGRTRELVAAIGTRLRRRAWSRAGAVASVVRSGAPRRVLTFSSRVALLVFGSFMISASVAVTLWNDLGPGPLDVFIGAVRVRTGLPLTIAVWATVGSLIVAAWALGRRPGLGTVASPFMIGPMMQTTLAGLEQFGAPSSLVVSIGVHLVAIAGIGIGAGALVVSGLGAGSGELFAGAASDRVRRPESRVRPLIESTWIVAGVLLGGPAGLGTVLVAVFIAPSVARGHRLVDGVAARSKHGLAVTHDAIISREMAALARENELIRR
ncbi:hypothetical protein YM304_07020 [Ilumatobacter coccineus YM16-304]|uniref:Uncharacterized protein n=1 Tax=Ilumatobacter coccineus (strain NBRC 103263 / KCTC 29153 / YM16-304) TaxID=1313172 RepID=A0A6C7EAG6_ILUCY|nr:hypothetical protein YM304_07020 [Ilumatobacter coccineus YM16-304]